MWASDAEVYHRDLLTILPPLRPRCITEQHFRLAAKFPRHSWASPGRLVTRTGERDPG